MEMMYPVEPPLEPPAPVRKDLARLPPVGWGFVLVVGSLAASYFDYERNPDAYFGFYTSVAGVVGAVFWLLCLHRLHRVIAQLTDGRHDVTPGMAVGMHFVPVVNLWWAIHWPLAYARFIRSEGTVKILPGVFLGILHLLFLLTKFVDGSLSLALTLCLLLYLRNRLRRFLEAGGHVVAADPTARPRRRWRRRVFGTLGGLALLVLAFFVAMGVGVMTGHFPGSAAVPAGKIHARQLQQLREMGVVEEFEQVQYFYSAALFSIRGDGNLFTDERVITYQELDGRLEIASAWYDEIAFIEFLPGGAITGDSVIEVTLHDESWFILFVSREGDGDARFHERLMRMWEAKRGAVGGA